MNTDASQQIEDFFAQYRLRRYHKGQVLILSGDDAAHVYHLVKGKVKQYDVTYKGDEVILNIFKPPAFFPMSLAINKAPSPYIYEAETDIEIRQVPADEAVAFLKANPEVLFNLLARVYKGVDGLLGRMAHLMASSAQGRLLYELLIEARRFGKSNTDGSCILHISETALAARAGLSRETVSREMSKLIQDKLVKTTRGKVFIDDIDALETKLGKAI